MGYSRSRSQLDHEWVRAATVRPPRFAPAARLYAKARRSGDLYLWMNSMSLLSLKGVLAITAVVDIALHAHGRPVPAKAVAVRQRLPPRYLEPVLQALVRQGILHGVPGQRGGYELAREQRHINADEILRAASTAEDASELPLNGSRLLKVVVAPALAQAEQVFSEALARINVQAMVQAAERGVAPRERRALPSDALADT